MPAVHAHAMMDSQKPRRALGSSSEQREKTGGTLAPMPTPAHERQRDSTCQLGANAAASPKEQFTASESAPVAVNTAQRMAANETRFYGVVPGQKVAVIENS